LGAAGFFFAGADAFLAAGFLADFAGVFFFDAAAMDKIFRLEGGGTLTATARGRKAFRPAQEPGKGTGRSPNLSVAPSV